MNRPSPIASHCLAALVALAFAIVPAAALQAAAPPVIIDSAEAENIATSTPTRVNISTGLGTGTYDYRVRVVDFWGTQVWTTTISSVTSNWSSYVMVPLPAYGSFTVYGELLTPGTTTVVTSKTSRVVYPVPVPPTTHEQRRTSYIGMNTHWGTKWHAFQKFGIHWARNYAYQWLDDGSAAPWGTNGTDLGGEWNTAKANNVTILPCTQHVFWNASETNYTTDMNYVTTAFRRYVQAFPEVDYWEMDNESNYTFLNKKGTPISAYHAAYRDVIHAARAGIDQANPSVKLCLDGDAGVRTDTYTEMLRTSGVSPVVRDDFDVIGYHFYAGTTAPELVARNSPDADTSLCQGWLWLDELFFDLVTRVNAMAHDAGKEVWFGEIGYAETDGRCAVGLTNQTRYVPRVYLLSRAAGCDKVFWFWDRDIDGTSWISHMGLIDNYGMARPMGAALAALSKFTAFSTAVGSGTFGADSHYVLLEQPDGGPLMAAWTRGLPMSYDASDASAVYDIFGNPIAPGMITLGPEVTYVFYGNVAPNAYAGEDQTIVMPDNVAELSGVVSDDGNPDPPGELTTQWSQVSGPAAVVFGDPAAVSTSATFPLHGVYVLRLTADDGEKQSSSDVTITYQAIPHLQYESTSLGDGKYGWTFRIYSYDGLLQPYTVAMGFQGVGGATIQQVTYNNMAIHTETMANLADGMGGYAKAQDTWTCSPFGDNTVAGTNPLTGGALTGFYQATNAFALSCYTGPSSAVGDAVPLAYVVADGNVGWVGTITRNGADYDAVGTTETPSPAGDYNGDGSVSGADYVIWADTFGNDGSPGKEDLRADGNGDGVVSGTDYVIWADNFGS